MNINTIIFRIALIVLIVEALIMEMISVIPVKISPIVETFVDSISLVLFTTPIIYFWVIKPFIIMKNKAMDEAAYLAFHDVLTGLPNRAKFFEWLDHALLIALENRTKVTLILLDLDRFKGLNNTYGHNVGDFILQHLSQKLQHSFIENGSMAKIGPDQFVFLIERMITDDEIYYFSKKIIDMVQEPIAFNEHTFMIDGSIGISSFPKDASNKDELLKYAQIAMRQAKTLEDDKINFYTLALTESVHRRFTLEEDLRVAIQNNEFTLVYQPKIDAKTDGLVGVEALIRWNHSEKGFISPADFIPLAEETGLIVAIGKWVLSEALDQFKIWMNQGHKPIVLSINFSGRQLKFDHVEEMIELLAGSNVPHRYIELEITETYLMSNPVLSQLLLEKMKQTGISLSMDDFGSGYSSLGYLKRFKMDVLKIDQLLIRDIENDKNGLAIVKAIIDIGHSLEMKVVAEGVETADQAAMLKEMGCDYFQGFYFSKPLKAEEIFLSDRYHY